MDLLQDLKKSLLNFNFVMIYTIHKVLVLIKNPLNYPKDNIFKFFLRNITDFYLFIFKQQHIMKGNPSSEEEKTIKDIRNLFRLKKGTNNW